ncbi:MAG: hypothetical protein EBS66_14835, partial [Betaproteobacteria bacterium]|nr:hypothetical protein [Betaproteobacteria bacterium]
MKKTPQLILLNALKDSKPSIFSKLRRSDDWMASAFALSFVGYLVKQALDGLIANDTKHHEWQLSSLLGTSLSLNTIYKVDEDVHLQVRVDALENLMALDSGLNELDGYHNRFVSKYLLADQANELQVTMQSAQDTESGALMDEVLAQRTAVEQSTETVTVDLNDLIVESPGRLPTVDLPQITPPAIQTAAGIDWMEIGLEYMGLGLLALAGGEVFSFTSGLLSAAADPVYAGTLVDGYIGNARVYRVGADGVTPLDGVVRITDKFGRFEALPDGAGKIVVEAVRNADGTFASKDYGFNPTLGTSIDFTYSLTLSAPGGVSTSAGPLVINPITTLIQSYIEANPTTTVADASFLVASRLGLSTTFDFMHTDPVAAVGSANFSADPAALAANLQTALAVQKVSTQLANFMITVAQSTSFDANTGDESKSVLTSLVSYMDASTGVISLSTSATLSDVLSAGSVNVSEATLTTLAQANNFATQSLSRVGDLQKSIVGQMLNVNAASVDEALQNIQEMLTAVANNKTLLDVTFVDGQSVGYELGRLTTFTDSPEIKIDLS